MTHPPRTPEPGWVFVLDPDNAPYTPTIYHLVWDSSEYGSETAPPASYRVLCRPRETDGKQLLRAQPAALAGPATDEQLSLCTHCKRRTPDHITIAHEL